MKNTKIIILTLLIFFLFTNPIFADQLELQNGTILRGEVDNNSINLKNSYAKIKIQIQFINKIDRANGSFVFNLAEKNRFSGQITDQISFKENSGLKKYNSANIKSIVFSNSSNFNDNKKVTITTNNGDFFFANPVEDGINVKTSLGSPITIKYNNIAAIEYLSSEKLYRIRRKNAAEVKANFSQEKIILWPAAGEIFEFDLNNLRKMTVN